MADSNQFPPEQVSSSSADLEAFLAGLAESVNQRIGQTGPLPLPCGYPRLQAPQGLQDNPNSSGFTLLPADGDLPAVQAGFTSALEASHPANTTLRRHIRGERDELSVAANLLCEAYLSLLRAWRILVVRHPQHSLCLRICSVLQRLVGHSLAITSRFSI